MQLSEEAHQNLVNDLKHLMREGVIDIEYIVRPCYNGEGMEVHVHFCVGKEIVSKAVVNVPTSLKVEHD